MSTQNSPPSESFSPREANEDEIEAFNSYHYPELQADIDIEIEGPNNQLGIPKYYFTYYSEYPPGHGKRSCHLHMSCNDLLFISS